ncbi:MAG: M3 family oligoendopeptidase [Alicyclobacillus sp.]|nr:M3 family oligoendopeptidase [Alicyclobacillus sp.]
MPGPLREKLNPTWDLDSIFAGGSRSETFAAFLSDLERDTDAFATDLQQRLDGATVQALADMLETVQDLASRQREAGAFVSCLGAADATDAGAKELRGRVSGIGAKLGGLFTTFDAALANLPEATWTALVAIPSVQSVRFSLEERRRRSKERMAPDLERLATDLMVDGYHGWSQLYDTIVGRMTLPYEENGRVQALSMGQAHNKMLSADKEVRDEVFAKWEKVWAENAELCADALNRIAGFRLALYRHRGWDSFLKEPLDVNRMDLETLETMWGVIADHKQPFIDYLERKAKVLGLEKLGWSDVEAPLEQTSRTVSYEEARDFIVQHFGRFSPRMAEFANHCFEARWIEAEDRPGKRPGAFCTSFPVSEQTRVFTTFSGTVGNVSTLAHELGHAYHQHVMKGLPRFAQNYAMNVAETASTFAEMITADAAVRQATSDAERVSLLDDKVHRSVAMFMNIHARFLFETRFYEERKRGLVSVARLCELMTEAQREAYGGALATYHPHFWASKLHFYITGTPFYNFPYTFGYLFSTGIYARSLEEGAAFADRYVALLRDTGSMRVEDLAQKHLGVDLHRPDFWESSIALAIADVEEFLRRTE